MINIQLDQLQIRETVPADFDDIMTIESAAFGSESEARLTADLLSDPSARPHLSLLAILDGRAVGHVLFTRVTVDCAGAQPLAHIMAPLAVLPDYQKQGAGTQLISRGLELLRERGAKLVFVLGHPDYYPRHGFVPNAEAAGYPTPYPIPAHHADCWMVQRLTDEPIASGRVVCADTMMKPEYWQE